jgi:3-dehydroquinate dehydratase-2
VESGSGAKCGALAGGQRPAPFSFRVTGPYFASSNPLKAGIPVRILVINGPNLNMLGKREPDVYGHTTLADVEKNLQARFPNVAFSFFQSNQEGDLIDSLQNADVDGIVLNGAGFTHTSVALRDGIASIDTPVVEVHISNIHAREAFRHQSLTAGVCVGSISGLGIEGYALAVQYFLSRASA